MCVCAPGESWSTRLGSGGDGEPVSEYAGGGVSATHTYIACNATAYVTIYSM